MYISLTEKKKKKLKEKAFQFWVWKYRKWTWLETTIWWKGEKENPNYPFFHPFHKIKKKFKKKNERKDWDFQEPKLVAKPYVVQNAHTHLKLFWFSETYVEQKLRKEDPISQRWRNENSGKKTIKKPHELKH